MRDSTSTNTTSVKTKPANDTWASQRINTKPIQDAVRVFGQTNMYVAHWSRQGKPPVVGQAWNDGDALQCAFACDQKVFTGANIGTETIQLLKYEGDHVTNQFYYEWIPLSEWKSASKTETTRELVRSGPVSPIYWKEKHILGSYDVAAQKADFAQAENFIKVSEAPTLGSMLVLVRNTGGGPAGCTCTKCAAKDLKQAKQLIVNDWGDFYVGNQWPVDKPIVKALNRPLKTPRGPEDHFVALWYHHGKPCMGRAWNHAGKIDVSFVDAGREFTGDVVGSMQMIVELPPTAAGFEYCWLPYEQASQYTDKDFAPVHMSHVAPCVIQIESHEILGSVNLKQERAEAAFDGRVLTLDGPKIQNLKVLCRKDRDDTVVI